MPRLSYSSSKLALCGSTAMSFASNTLYRALLMENNPAHIMPVEKLQPIIYFRLSPQEVAQCLRSR